MRLDWMRLGAATFAVLAGAAAHADAGSIELRARAEKRVLLQGALIHVHEDSGHAMHILRISESLD